MDLSRLRTPVLAISIAIAFPPAVHAATKTATFRVQATVQSDCTITATTLDFGNVFAATGTLTANVDATSQINVTCTPNAAFTIALNQGDVATSTIAARQMSNSAQLLAFQLYGDTARSQIWGDGSAGSTTVGGTGDGTTHSHTVYGRIPPQPLPPVGNYVSNVTATITY